MRSAGAAPRPSRPAKCEKSSPTDSVAEVNTQAAGRAVMSDWKRAEMSKGSRPSVKPRPVASSVRAPSASLQSAMRSKVPASSVARPATVVAAASVDTAPKVSP